MARERKALQLRTTMRPKMTWGLLSLMLVAGSAEARAGGADPDDAGAGTAADDGAAAGDPDVDAAGMAEEPAGEVIEIVDDSAPDQSVAARRAMSVVDAEGLARQSPRTTAEALSYVPGVSVQKTNHAGGSPIIRGLTGQKVLLMIDGFRLSNAIMRPGANQYLITIDPGMVGGIEVLRGAGSVLYGSDAVGGVVHVRTREIDATDGDMHGRVEARTASADRSGRGRLELAGRAGRVRARVGASGGRFGDLRGSGPIGAGTDAAAQVPIYAGDRQRFTGYDELSGDGRVAWQLGPGHSLTAAVYAYRQYDAPRTDKCSPESCLVFDRQEYDLTYLRYRGGYGPVHDLTAGVALSRTGEQRSQRDAIAGMIERERDRVLGVSTYARAALWPWRIGAATLHVAAGVDGYGEGLASEAAVEAGERTDALVRGKFLDGSSQAALGGYGVAELELGERVSFDVGLRLSASRARVSVDPESGATGFVSWQTLPVGSAGLLARVAGPVSLAVHVDRAFRAPNLYDLTARSSGSGPGYQLPNPGLTAETARSLEAGIQVRSRRLMGDVFGYVTNLRDFITRQPASCPPELVDRCGDAGAVFRAVNADAATVRGLEAAARAELGAGLSLFASATWTRGDARFADGMTEPLAKIPPLHGAAMLSRQGTRVVASVAVRWALPQRRLAPLDVADSRIPTGGTPGHAIFDARIGADLRDGLRATLVLENLLDSPHRVHGSGVDGAGRGAVVSIIGEIP